MSRIASPVDVDHVLNICQRRCDDHGVHVRFDPHVQTAYTTGTQIVLPTVQQPITQAGLDKLYGLVVHECGHHLRPGALKILNSVQPGKELSSLYNIVEDDGMERERALEWRGDKKALAVSNSIIAEDIIANWRQATAIGGWGDQDPRPLAVLAMQQLSRLDWDQYSGTSSANLLNAMPDDAKQLFVELEKEGWVDTFRNSGTEYDTWDVTIDLYKRLYPDADDDEMEEMRQKGHDTKEKSLQECRNEGQAGERSNVGNSGGEDQESEEGSGKGDGDEGSEQHGEGFLVSWEDCVLSEHNDWASSKRGVGNAGIDWTGFTNGNGAALAPTNQINVVDLSITAAEDNSYYYQNVDAFLGNHKDSRAFGNKMRRYIQAEARSKVRPERYHGRLDQKGLVRLALPPIDGGEYNKRIFYTQERKPMKDTAIFVLTDWSGSMGGTKMEYAADASQRLVHVFERILRVPVALACFSNGETKCDIGYIKKYNTRGLSANEIATRFYTFQGWSSGNNDADSINWAWHQLLRRKEARKILIVLSDGAPTGTMAGGHPHENLQYITNAIEKDKRVELYGVGIKSSAVENYYTNHKTLRQVSEINPTLFNIIKEGNHVK